MLQTYLKLQPEAIESADEVVSSLEKVVDALRENVDVKTIAETLEWMSGLNANMNDEEIVKVC